ncbi:hypothetical protein CIPAW_02G105000 [Carya illinoinensis]|nr:hypothetical protein CIPAW_02G105000 [Carya illinoinensis]
MSKGHVKCFPQLWYRWDMKHILQFFPAACSLLVIYPEGPSTRIASPCQKLVVAIISSIANHHQNLWKPAV